MARLEDEFDLRNRVIWIVINLSLSFSKFRRLPGIFRSEGWWDRACATSSASCGLCPSQSFRSKGSDYFFNHSFHKTMSMLTENTEDEIIIPHIISTDGKTRAQFNPQQVNCVNKRSVYHLSKPSRMSLSHRIALQIVNNKQ